MLLIIAIKFVKRNEAELIKQRFVEAISANHSRDFWTEVNRMKSNGSNSVSSVVDGLSDCSEITELLLINMRISTLVSLMTKAR